MADHIRSSDVRKLTITAALLLPGAAQAHGFALSTEHWATGCLAAAAVGYALGLYKIRVSSTRKSRAVNIKAMCFGAGWLALAIALISPLDALGAELFSAHMLQHELLMLVAAPLLVLGRPLAIWTWACNPRFRRALAQAIRFPVVSNSWTLLNRPLFAWTLHAAVLWGWHLPAWFGAASADPVIHALQHLSFFLSALLFWQVVLRARPAGTDMAMLVYLFTTMLHTGALGALLTFSSNVWYGLYGTSALRWGMGALEDQQLGGLIMWIPGGAVYILVGLTLAARALMNSAARKTRLGLGPFGA